MTRFKRHLKSPDAFHIFLAASELDTKKADAPSEKILFYGTSGQLEEGAD